MNSEKANEDQLSNDWKNLRHNALRNALYHSARRMWFEKWNRWFNFAVVILGASAMASVTDKIGVDPIWIGGLVALVGSLQLVFDLGGQSRTHQSLQRDYYRLLADIERNTKPTEKHISEFRSEMTRIYADEPPILRAIDAKAYNDAIDGLGDYDKEERLIIPFFHTLTGWFTSHDGHEYKSYRQIREEREAAQAVG